MIIHVAYIYPAPIKNAFDAIDIFNEVVNIEKISFFLLV